MALHQNFCDKRVNVRNKEEQEMFEKWAMSQGTYSLSKEIDGSYLNGKTRCAFRAWVARSKIGSGWISVLDRMPDCNTDVQVYCGDSREQFVAYYVGQGYFHYATYETTSGYVDIECKPTHWQPLPSPPEQV